MAIILLYWSYNELHSGARDQPKQNTELISVGGKKNSIVEI